MYSQASGVASTVERLTLNVSVALQDIVMSCFARCASLFGLRLGSGYGPPQIEKPSRPSSLTDVPVRHERATPAAPQSAPPRVDPAMPACWDSADDVRSAPDSDGREPFWIDAPGGPWGPC